MTNRDFSKAVIDMKKKFSCCIIGQGKLTIDCARQLLDQGHIIHAIVSANQDVRDWAEQREIPTIDDSHDQYEFLARWSFDYLFSIINPNKVSYSILQLPKCLAINFHDAPLPRYAGLHVTSWAIACEEKIFGVTWHEMTEQFDAGRILKQLEFPIDLDETAFSLNVKCFQKGSEAFAELITELSTGSETLRPQDLNQRSSFLASKRPDSAAIIDWAKPSTNLLALTRALSFQPDSNSLGLPKILISDAYYLLLDVEINSELSNHSPGIVQNISETCIDVSTNDGVVSLKKLLTIDGLPISIDQMVANEKLSVGSSLPQLSDGMRGVIHEYDHRVGRNEKYWQKRLLKSEPFLFPQQIKIPGTSFNHTSLLGELSDSFLGLLNKYFPGREVSDLIVLSYYCFLTRIGDVESFDIGLDYTRYVTEPFELNELFVTRMPFGVSIDTSKSIMSVFGLLLEALDEFKSKGVYCRDLFARNPGLVRPELSIAVEVNEGEASDPQQGDALILSIHKGQAQYGWRYNPELISPDDATRITEAFTQFTQNLSNNFDASLDSLSLISEQDRNRLLVQLNQTSKDYDNERCIHQLFEDQVKLRPTEAALAFRDKEISYAELNSRANQVAYCLKRAGAVADMPIGIFIDRSLDMVIGLLGILKSGAAYVPLDPVYPRDRIALMIDDAALPVLLTQSGLRGELPKNNAKIICIDEVLAGSAAPAVNEPSKVAADNLAYVIYTSGSTGKPKGVMIEHRNVMNFFAGMDDTLGYKGDSGVWLAVTSISFDISVLEIFWTLSRGFKVVVQEEDTRTLAQDAASSVPRKMDVGLFYFSSDAGPSENNNRYKLLLEGAKFADANNFSSVWTPERHFHLFGGLYPNPSVTSAAIAAVTNQIAIRAGSIVLPLHNPVRVVEEWSVVDNLSGGRVGFSFASGWHANDFSLLPDNYANRKQIMYDNIETVRELWSGKEVTLQNGEGNPFTARVYPAPVQEEPPMWITTAGNIDSFRQAGEGGFNILTNLLGQSIADIKEKIAAYREGRKKNGYKGDGNVSVMVHTFVGADLEEVREIVREPFCSYLKTSFDLVKIAPWAFPAFKQPSKSAAQDPSFDADTLTEEDLDALLDHAFERYFETAGIFGTPTSCLPLIDDLKRAGVDEVACLIDFGVEEELVLESLNHLNKLRELANPQAKPEEVSGSQDFSIAAQILRHKVTHFQCTPSMARILSADPAALSGISSLQKVLLGGEALPIDLATILKQELSGDFINVYGPTETTIWSTSAPVPENAHELSIGRPIANTKIYILDSHLQPTPIGMPGELCIGGAGVVRGYLGRRTLTDERFISNPFIDEPNARIYRTGDLVRYRENGEIEYLGRLDHQVKLRGYRIELGEIEALICANLSVRDAVVVVSEAEDGAQSLVAYIVPELKAVKQDVPDQLEASSQYWQTIWDETYQLGTHSHDGTLSSSSVDPTLNISGWLNSYTGDQHSERDMLEWVTATTDRVLALKPKRVLEIGCGTGMVLYRVAPHCTKYVGVDFSAHALDLIQQQISALGWKNVQLVESAADTVALPEAEPFDLIIINSVIQYFPSSDYLVKVLKNLSSLISDKSQIFIGDVRSLPLMDSFHLSLELARAPANLTLSELDGRVKERRENESELVIAPEYFFALQKEIPWINAINVQLKRGVHHNEMSQFRYDVCLSAEVPVTSISESEISELAIPESLSSLQEQLATQSGCFVIRDIVNPRVEGALYIQKMMKLPGHFSAVSDMHVAMTGREDLGIDPEEIYQLASADWRVELCWASSGGKDYYDAYFIPSADSTVVKLTSMTGSGQLTDYVFEPKHHTPSDILTEQLKELLREKLPEFMVPNEYMMLKALPLTPNGKIDRKALPKPEKRLRDVKEEFVAPQGDVEQTIAAVLQEMLNLEKIGTKDNFTDLGANSLLIVQANNRINQKLKRKVSLVSMYRYPTIASLAEHLTGNADSQQSAKKGQQRGEKRKAAQANRRGRLARRGK